MEILYVLVIGILLVDIKNSKWYQSRCQERPLAQGSELLSSIAKCFFGQTLVRVLSLKDALALEGVALGLKKVRQR